MSMVSKQGVVLGEPRRTLSALFVTLQLELLSQFLCGGAGKGWKGGASGVNRDL